MRHLRVAVEGCGHGTLNAIYASVNKACQVKGWDGVDVLIIGGDFQAVRNASDLTVMSCPVKYRKIGDFHSYYKGIRKAPYLTIFVGGNHEASNHLWELFYGGWVAPNMYYMGAANVLRVGGVRIAGMSGIWKGYDYRRPHFERIPYNQDDIRSIYHVREIDTRKLLQIRTKVDVGISHDWPKAVELHGNTRSLFRKKPDFEQESKSGTLGNEAAKLVMDRLRPPFWFSAHMHCKYAATKIYAKLGSTSPKDVPFLSSSSHPTSKSNASFESGVPRNVDEIDLDFELTKDSPPSIDNLVMCVDHDGLRNDDQKNLVVPEGILEELPAAFSQPRPSYLAPAEITNTTVRFLSLDKCLPGRKFLQLLTIASSQIPNKSPKSPHKSPKSPHRSSKSPQRSSKSSRCQKVTFEYDPEWLAITRVFNSAIVLGDRNAETPPDLGEAHYFPMIQKEREWIEENVVKPGKLKIPENFVITAPPFRVGTPEIVKEGPREYNNPQTQQFCDLIGIQNKFFATEEEKIERLKKGPAPLDDVIKEEPKSFNPKGGRGRSRNNNFRSKHRGHRRNHERNP